MRAGILAVLIGWLALVLPAQAQEPAVARVDAAASSLRAEGTGVTLRLALSRAVPWRLRHLDGPPRLVLDFRTVDWSGLRLVPEAPQISAIRAGVIQPGWSRLVLDLAGPLVVGAAGLATGQGADGQGALLTVTLAPASAQAFAEQAARPDPPGWALPAAQVAAPGPRAPDAPLVVVLDPGHGGIDPGAEREAVTEAALMLDFARELRLLLRQAGFAVVMTREADVFVPLESRISIAHGARADVFVSLHADALAQGQAAGATIYTLDAGASEAAGRALAERHDKDDLMAGVDLTRQDDLVAGVLMDMARARTAPRTERLAFALQEAILGQGLQMHPRPVQRAAFSVLKSPDIPSVLIELGFLSSYHDLLRLTDPEWRAAMAGAIRDGLRAWAAAEDGLR